MQDDRLVRPFEARTETLVERIRERQFLSINVFNGLVLGRATVYQRRMGLAHFTHKQQPSKGRLAQYVRNVRALATPTPSNRD
jgi:hypothetical protein